MSYKINEDTGLPELPEGFIWQVKFEDADEYGFNPYGSVSVSLRPKSGWKKFWNGCTTKSVLLHYRKDDYSNREVMPLEDYPSTILHLAEQIMVLNAEWAVKELHTEAQKGVTEKLSGLYPPKKLVIK